MSTLLIRHGNKEPGKGKIDPALTQKGKLQSILTGQFLKQYPANTWKDRPILVSPFKRTLQTSILALAQIDFDDDNIPKLIVDERISETIEDASCVCSTKEELLAWIDGNLNETIRDGLDEAVLEGQIQPDEIDAVYDRIEKILDNIDLSRIENNPAQEIWPQNGSKPEGYETPQDAQQRMADIKGEYGDNLLLFTHSTFIGAVVQQKLSATFGASADPDVGAVQTLQAQVEEAGIYEEPETVGEGPMEVIFAPGDPYEPAP